MLTSCSRVAGRGCQRIISDPSPALGHSTSQSFLQGRSQQQTRNTTLSHVRGLRRPKRGAVSDEALDFQSQPTPVRGSPTNNSALAQANMELARLNDRHRMSTAFDVCRRLKEANVKPDSTTYDHLLSLCAHHSAPMEAWAILEDMCSMGITPDRSAFHHVISVMQWALEKCGELGSFLQFMQERGIDPDSKTFDLIISRMLQSNNVELALQYLATLSEQGMVPLVNTAEGIIRTACNLNLPRLALDLAQSFEETSVRRLDGDIWMDCLIASAETLYADGVRLAWQKCVHELKMIPDEGCCIRVLNTAGREGLPQLGLDVIRVLQTMRIAWEEHHFAPLVEAFSRSKEIKQAFEVLGNMQSYKVTPNSGTAYPIFRAIAGNIDQLDMAWQSLDQLHSDGKLVDVAALNVVVKAAVRVQDLQRALGIYKSFSDFSATPNIDTFNTLLSGCVKASHRELGDRLLKEMKEANVKPDITTYTQVIFLCLTQATYEDAFYYLEEMKGEGFVPPQNVYAGIIRKCVLTGDPRHKLALEEMLSQGYEVSEGLQAFVDSGGEVRENQERAPESEIYASTRDSRGLTQSNSVDERVASAAF